MIKIRFNGELGLKHLGKKIVGYGYLDWIWVFRYIGDECITIELLFSLIF